MEADHAEDVISSPMTAGDVLSKDGGGESRLSAAMPDETVSVIDSSDREDMAAGMLAHTGSLDASADGSASSISDERAGASALRLVTIGRSILRVFTDCERCMTPIERGRAPERHSSESVLPDPEACCCCWRASNEEVEEE